MQKKIESSTAPDAASFFAHQILEGMPIGVSGKGGKATVQVLGCDAVGTPIPGEIHPMWKIHGVVNSVIGTPDFEGEYNAAKNSVVIRWEEADDLEIDEHATTKMSREAVEAMAHSAHQHTSPSDSAPAASAKSFAM